MRPLGENTEGEDITEDKFLSPPAVLQIPELLESILLCLPVRQILDSQRVCKNWRLCALGSVGIRQALFLHPLGDRFLSLDREKEQQSTHEWTPEMQVGRWIYDSNPNRCIKPIINPLVPEFLLTQFSDYVAFLHYGFVEEKFDPQREQDRGIARSGPQSSEHRDILHRDAATWRSMLIMQPPCIEISIRCLHEYLLVQNSNGVTFQDVLSGIREHYCEKQHFSSNHWIECWDVEGFNSKEVQVRINFETGPNPNMSALDLLTDMECLR